MPPAARKNDMILHDVAAHCHAPHPAPPGAPVPVPVPPGPLPIQMATVPTVKIAKMDAATVSSQSKICNLPGCPKPPGSPGMISKGSATVMIGKKPAARVGDLADFKGCAGPVPAPTGKIIPPGAPTVMIGG